MTSLRQILSVFEIGCDFFFCRTERERAVSLGWRQSLLLVVETCCICDMLAILCYFFSEQFRSLTLKGKASSVRSQASKRSISAEMKKSSVGSGALQSQHRTIERLVATAQGESLSNLLSDAMTRVEDAVVSLFASMEKEEKVSYNCVGSFWKLRVCFILGNRHCVSCGPF